MIDIALVGCGAIGSSVLALLAAHAPHVQVRWVLVPHPDEALRATVARHAPRAQVLAKLPGSATPDLLLECAGHSAIEEHVLPALERGVACVVASIGALATPGLVERLEAAALAGASRVHLPSGALGAMDALAAARFGGLDEVRYTGRKPPLAWLGTPAEQNCDLHALAGQERAVRIFCGSAREAARLYPKNANVAATTALAGLGLERTRVDLYADPGVAQNVHHLSARGAFGEMEFKICGKPLAANPKTSALTVLSLVRTVLNCAAARVVI